MRPRRSFVVESETFLEWCALCLVAFSAIAIFTFSQNQALAVNTQADTQCPSGGVVGQTCKDTTNGYTTQGKCTHINVCRAESWPKEPKGGCGMNGPYSGGSGCPIAPPLGKPMPMMPPKSGIVPPSNTPTSTPAYPSGFDAFDSIYGSLKNTNPDGVPDNSNPSLLGTTSIGGSEYLVTSDHEQLKVGESLDEIPVKTAQTPQTRTIGQLFTLTPQDKQRAEVAQIKTQEQKFEHVQYFGAPSVNVDLSYEGSSSIASTSTARTIIGIGLDAVSESISAVGRMIYGSRIPADRVSDDVTFSSVSVADDQSISLYNWRDLPVEIDAAHDFRWGALVAALPNIGRFHKGPSAFTTSALGHLKDAGLNIVSFNFQNAGSDLSAALQDARAATQLFVVGLTNQ